MYINVYLICIFFFVNWLGSKKTLWDDIPNEKYKCISEKLLEFHSKWYSSHLMYLTILGEGIN